MESLIILIPIALIFIAIAIRLFCWAVDDGQFDDLEGPAHIILFDEDNQSDKTDIHSHNKTSNNKKSHH